MPFLDCCMMLYALFSCSFLCVCSEWGVRPSGVFLFPGARWGRRSDTGPCVHAVILGFSSPHVLFACFYLPLFGFAVLLLCLCCVFAVLLLCFSALLLRSEGTPERPPTLAPIRGCGA